MLFLPVNVTLEVTNQCNLSCKHCFRHSSSRMNDELSSDEIEAVLDQLLELGTVQIEVSGGEPLLHPNIFGLLEAIVGRGFETTLITNGTKLNREQCSRLRAIGVTNIQVSVDGTENDHESSRPRKLPIDCSRPRQPGGKRLKHYHQHGRHQPFPRQHSGSGTAGSFARRPRVRPVAIFACGTGTEI